VEEKIIVPLFYLNEKDKESVLDQDQDNDEEDTDTINHINNVRNLITFNSLYERFNIEAFSNNVNLIYNTYIYNLRNNELEIDESTEKKIKSQIIFNNFLKKYLKCNIITFLIMTELL